MKHNSIPEEKLLSLIKGQKPARPVEFAQPQTPARKCKEKQAGVPWLSFRKTLLVCFFVSCASLAAAFIYSWVGLKNIAIPRLSPRNETENYLLSSEAKKPFSFYQEVAAKRNIFIPQAVAEARPLDIASGDLVKDITLVGIISGANPQAIVEDKKAQKTYYVNKGQAIGEFQVEEILEGKIILNYNGEKYELYL
jgi:hypothetical protein